MPIQRPKTAFHVPDGVEEREAVARTTHLGIGAHADDLEFMAYSGIAECHENPHKWFGGVTVTDGANPPSGGPYATCTPEEMIQLRIEEQNHAADIGGYAFMAQLGHSSLAARNGEQAIVEQLVSLLEKARPQIVYLHQPFDKHPTHMGVLKCSLMALRQLDPAHHPERVYGCEVWRGLDWLPEACKVALPTHARPLLAERLFQCFRSQIKGGKRYDLAVPSRWLANATFNDSHAADAMSHIAWGLDLTPLIHPDGPALATYMRRILDDFETALGLR